MKSDRILPVLLVVVLQFHAPIARTQKPCICVGQKKRADQEPDSLYATAKKKNQISCTNISNEFELSITNKAKQFDSTHQQCIRQYHRLALDATIRPIHTQTQFRLLRKFSK